MTGHAASAHRKRCLFLRAVAVSAALVASASWAQSPAAAKKSPEPPPAEQPGASALDAPLFYQVLIGEIELRAGRPGNAYEVILDAARRQGDEALYQRAVDIALQARAGDQALTAARAWRGQKPKTVAPLRYEAQILLALDRPEEAAEPLSQWLALAPAAERPGLIASLPRQLQGVREARQQIALIEKLTLPYRDAVDTRVPVALAQARTHLAAGDTARALGLATRAQQADPAAPGPALIAMELMAKEPGAQKLIDTYLARPEAEPAVRLAYVRQLMQVPRYTEASVQLERITADRPTLAEPWLMLGALRVELKQAREAEPALLRYIELARAPDPAAAAAAGEDNDDDGGGEGQTAAGINQAWLLLAQAAEQRGDLPAAEAWLAKVDNPQRLLEVQTRRATLLARQGKLNEARALIQSVPERTGDDTRAKVLAEAQVLRDVKRWREAAEVLQTELKRQADDVDVMYELAMVEEKLERFGEMERLLRRVIALKPEHPHAHNALGYSMADRNVRLNEAKDLIQRALSLSPGDPFITDSLGWVEFRLGRRDEAIRLLRQAYTARPDTEIAAHLGEVLWAAGQRDEARRVWQEARAKDAANEVLKETLARLKVGL